MDKKLVKVCPQVIELKDPELNYYDIILSGENRTLLKLDNNESTLPPSEKVLNSLKKTIEGETLNHHPDYNIGKLKRKLSHYAGVSFNSITCFGNEASMIESIGHTYLKQGLDALATWPNEGLVSHYLCSTGARVINSQFEDPFKPRIEELISGISNKTRLIYIGNPNPITGSLFSEAELVFLLSYAENIMIVVDETYFEYSGCTIADMIESYPNLIVVRSLSRAFALAGMDISYIMTDPENLKFINRLAIGKYPNMLARNAAMAALEDSRHLENTIYQINESKKMLYSGLNMLGYDFTISPANFITLKVTEPEKFTLAMAEKNIYVKHLIKYHGFENHIRITIGTPDQTGILLDILSQIRTGPVKSSHNRLNRLTEHRALSKS